jgi:hypothetical protein
MHYPPVPCYLTLLSRNIFLGTQFSNALGLCSSYKAKDKIVVQHILIFMFLYNLNKFKEITNLQDVNLTLRVISVSYCYQWHNHSVNLVTFPELTRFQCKRAYWVPLPPSFRVSCLIQFMQKDSGTVSSNRTRPLPSISFPIHYPAVNLPFDSV